MRVALSEAFGAQTGAALVHADARLVLSDPDLAPFVVPEPGDPPMHGWEDLQPGAGHATAADWVRPAADPDRLAILQFTSGSTSDPKGVLLPHPTVGAKLDALAQATTLDPAADVAVSWLPLYHARGLVRMVTLSLTSGQRA